MRKLLMLIGAMIICNAYGEAVIWYADGNNISATSCAAGGNITQPANPTKSGYRFIGWKVAGVDDAFFAIAGTSYTYTNDTSNSTYKGSWTTTFPYGTVSGRAVLSTTNGTPAASSTGTASSTGFSTRDTEPPLGVGTYCWCQATSATVKGVSVSVSPKWWLAYRATAFNDIKSACPIFCGDPSRNGGFGKASFKYIRKFAFTGSTN